MKKYNTNLFGQKLNVSQAIDSNAEGKGTITRNIGENANGTFNVSNTGSEDSKQTIHPIVGIGRTVIGGTISSAVDGEYYANVVLQVPYDSSGKVSLYDKYAILFGQELIEKVTFF